MPRAPISTRTLADRRPWLLASLAAAIAYYFLWNNEIGGLWLILLKGAGCAALAGYCFRHALGTDGWLIGAAMAFSSLGDMGIELDFTLGGAAFFCAHIAAIALYLRHPRPEPTSSQKLAGIALLLLTPLASWLLSQNWQVALYAVALGGMAAAAWWSAFPRYRVGLGAVLFVTSDLLIFAREGPMQLGWPADALVWPLYFGGQFLIATGVVQTLKGWRRVPA